MTVGSSQLAAAFAKTAGESFPAVLATPSLIGLLERTAASVLQPFLAHGEMSVGVSVNLVHKAPTAAGQSVTARAELTRREGRLFVFDVRAEDAGGIVAAGEHARTIVEATAIEREAQRRAQNPTVPPRR